jgi:hypothetical protein
LIKLAQNMGQWWDIMDTVMNLPILQIATDLNLQIVACHEISLLCTETVEDLHVLRGEA